MTALHSPWPLQWRVKIHLPRSAEDVAPSSSCLSSSSRQPISFTSFMQIRTTRAPRTLTTTAHKRSLSNLTSTHLHSSSPLQELALRKKIYGTISELCSMTMSEKATSLRSLARTKRNLCKKEMTIHLSGYVQLGIRQIQIIISIRTSRKLYDLRLSHVPKVLKLTKGFSPNTRF